jgi:hypothetical protein
VQQEFAYATQVMIHCRIMPVEREHLIRFFQPLVPYYYAREAFMTRVQAAKWKMLVYAQFVHFQAEKKPKVFDQVSARRFYNSFDALHAGANLSVTDERDRVYGILSLLKNVHDEIAVDYHKSALDVFRDVAALLLRKYNSLVFLSLAGIHQSGRRNDFPSWVPYPGKSNVALFQHHKSFEQLQQVLSHTPNTRAILPLITSDVMALQAHACALAG